MSEFYPTPDFPSKPTCHKDERQYPGITVQWNPPMPPRPNPEPDPYRETFRTCYYCGSIHPEDLLRFLSQGNVTLHGADWKYGWPHKYYIEGIPNPIAGQDVIIGSEGASGDVKPLYGKAPEFVHAKWYNTHFTDEGFSMTKLKELVEAVNKNLDHGIDYHGEEWFIGPGGVGYRKAGDTRVPSIG